MYNKVDSKFSIYSIGVVAEDKSVGDWDISVVPTELITDLNGDISATDRTTTNVLTPDGDNKSISIESGNTITATWLQFGSSRSTPPDVCKGETVLLFHYAGTDQYYWIPLFFEPDLRKREAAMFYFSNRDNIDDNNGLLEKGYYLRVDTYDKLVKLHTGTGDGEKCGYDIYVNTGDGMFKLGDTNNNSMTLDSDKGHLEFNFKTVALKNEKDELISVLIELLDAMLIEQHIGNLGAPTNLTPTSQETYKQLKAKLEQFKG